MQSRLGIYEGRRGSSSSQPLTCCIGAALVVPESAKAAGSRGEGRAAGGGPKSGPDGVVLEATGLAAGTEVSIGRCQAGGVHASHT